MPDEIGDMDKAVKDLDEALSAELEPVDDLAVPLPDIYKRKWDRQPGESDYGWQLFNHYRDQGIKRNTKATVNFAFENLMGSDKGEQTLKRYKRSVSNLCEKFKWKDRVFQYDQEQERLYQLARSEAIRDMAKRHEAQIEKAIDGLMTPIEALTIAMNDNEEFMADLTNMDKKKLISLANLAARTIPSLMAAERLSRGMPTEIVSGVVEHQHVKVVERDQIGSVLEILGQAGVLNVGSSDIGAGDIVDAEVVEVHSVPTEGDDG